MGCEKDSIETNKKKKISRPLFMRDGILRQKINLVSQMLIIV
jgi:hypothetical protein